MLDKKKQVANTFIYILPLVPSNLLPIISIPIFTRILSPEDYGFFALAIFYGSVICGLANFGMNLAFERNYFQYRDIPVKLAQLLYSSLTFVIANFVVIVLITYLFKDDISIFLTGSAQHGYLIVTACVGQFFFGTVNNLFLIYFKNEGNAKSFAKHQILSSILYFIVSLFLVAHMKVGIIGLALAQGFTGFVLFIYLLCFFLKKFHFSLNKKILLESLKFCYPLTPSLLFRLVGSQFDKYLIGLLGTVGGVGVYHIGKRFTDITFSFMTSLQNVFGPQVYERMFENHQHKSESIGRYLTPFLYVTIFLAHCLALASEELLTILTPVSYHGAIPIITILCMYYVVFFFEKLVGMQLTYVKKTHIISLIQIWGPFINIAFSIPLILKYGAIGAAWGALLCAFIIGPVDILVGQYYYKINWEWNKIFWIMGIMFAGSFSIVFMYLLDAPYLWSLSVKILTLAVFLNLGFRYRIISRENYLVIKDALSLRRFSKGMI